MKSRLSIIFMVTAALGITACTEKHETDIRPETETQAAAEVITDAGAQLENYFNNDLLSKYELIEEGEYQGDALTTKRGDSIYTHYIADFDKDGQEEMLVVFSRELYEYESYIKNNLLQIYEVDASGVRLQDERDYGNDGYTFFGRSVVFLHEYNGKPGICCTECYAVINLALVTSNSFYTYDCERLFRELCLYDPGYTDGFSIYSSDDEENRVYDDGSEDIIMNYDLSDVSFGEDDHGESFEEFYSRVLSDQGKPFGLTVTTHGEWTYRDSFQDGEYDIRTKNCLPMYTSDDAEFILSVYDYCDEVTGNVSKVTRRVCAGSIED